jgi:L-threonylcarbamoyladenylate synthase
MILPGNDPAALHVAADTIRAGGLVAFPTETVYGLGCDALNLEAVQQVFRAKRRPAFDPLIVHVADRTRLDLIVRDVPPRAHRLMERFWPGPLTLVLPKQARVPDAVTAGRPTVAVRQPAHPVAQALLKAAGIPIAAPSANPFGYVSPTTASHVLDGLGEEVSVILDGGPCPIGVESTILSLADPTPRLLRPGGVARQDIEAVIGLVEGPASHSSVSLAPGQSPRHYATHTPVTILPGDTRWSGDRHPEAQERAGLLAMSSAAHRLGGRFCAVEVLSSSGDLAEAAANLFAALRRLDRLGLDRLYVEPCPEQGLGAAIMDRLRRCAAPHDPLSLQCEQRTPRRLAKEAL